MITFRCPNCGKEVAVAKKEDLPSRPFCSSRCKMVDLYRWFNEEYRISTPIPSDAPDEPIPGGRRPNPPEENPN